MIGTSHFIFSGTRPPLSLHRGNRRAIGSYCLVPAGKKKKEQLKAKRLAKKAVDESGAPLAKPSAPAKPAASKSQGRPSQQSDPNRLRTVFDLETREEIEERKRQSHLPLSTELRDKVRQHSHCPLRLQGLTASVSPGRSTRSFLATLSTCQRGLPSIVARCALFCIPCLTSSLAERSGTATSRGAHVSRVAGQTPRAPHRPPELL
jgi:hypothetical protein